MTLKQLITLIAKKEAKKSQVKIGNIREIVGIISDAIYSDVKVQSVLYNAGKRRAKTKAKK